MLDHEIEALEARLREGMDDLARMRRLVRRHARSEWGDIRHEWDALDGRVRTVAVALGVAFFLGAYLFYMNLGWYADQRALPESSDWLLDRLPAWNVVPML
ncbi:MAG: hypothetical protein OEV20_09535, partial [Actinomycetota bacterium]|nr:hypothetical protein [Actinomycetota bacterium]